MARASSIRSRRPVSGVRSWCDASATNSVWARSARASRSVIRLNERASERCSRLPSTSARASRSPEEIVSAAAPSRSIGRVIPRASRNAATSAASSTASPTAAIPSTVRRTALLTASTLCVSRTPPTTAPALNTGRAVARIDLSSVSERRSSWNGRPRSAAASSGRLEKSTPIASASAVSASTIPRRSTTTTRARAASPTVLASSPRRSRSRVSISRGTPAASTAAWVRAVARTSSPTRSRRFAPRGTANATITRATR